MRDHNQEVRPTIADEKLLLPEAWKGPRISRREFAVAASATTGAMLGCEHWDNFRYGSLSKAVSPAHGAMSSPTDSVLDLYAISVGDLLEIKFPYRADLSETVTVREDGMIALPFIDPVMAVGLSPDVLQATLVEAYQKLEYNPLAKPEADAAKDYLISPNDVLEIKFDRNPEYNDSVTVRPDGKISLALVHTVQAEGKTPEQLEAELTKLYAKHLKFPDLVVIVRQFTNEKFYANGKSYKPGLRNLEGLTVIVRSTTPRLIYVGGEVNRAGFYNYTYPMTALQAILMAGGIQRTAKLRSTVLLRKFNQKEPIIMILNLKPDWRGVGSNDVPLRPFDVIIVPKTTISKVLNFMNQYVYELIPMTRNMNFTVLYNFTNSGSTFPINSLNTNNNNGGGGAGAGS